MINTVVFDFVNTLAYLNPKREDVIYNFLTEKDINISKSKIVDTGRNSLYPDRGTLNIDKARQLVNYKPTMSLENGLESYYGWLQNKI